jgi:hypothetical protein
VTKVMMPKKLIVQPPSRFKNAFVSKLAAHPFPNEKEDKAEKEKGGAVIVASPDDNKTTETPAAPAVRAASSLLASASGSAPPAAGRKQLLLSQDERDVAEIAANLPKIKHQRMDLYGQPYYRAWSPQNAEDDSGGGYAGEDCMVGLVHYVRDSVLDSKIEDEYMTFAQLKKHSTVLREVPYAVWFGSDIMFIEDEKRKKARLEVENQRRKEEWLLSASTSMDPDDESQRKKALRPLKPAKGDFRAVWRRTWADYEGY